MERNILKLLQDEGLLSNTQAEKIDSYDQSAPKSIFAELNILLYAGIVLFTTGAGIAVYKNIGSIGHSIVIGLLGLLCVACFYYTVKRAKGYANCKVQSPGTFYDYMVLLGSLLLPIFFCYIQYKYNILGHRWEIATFVPMVLLFVAAYFFDHLGVLSLAIVNLAAWIGISLTPLQLIQSGNFGDTYLSYIALVLAIFLMVVGIFSEKKKIKAHFGFTYKNFGFHLLMIALLLLLMSVGGRYILIWGLVLAIAVTYFFVMSIREKSFYFLLFTSIYGYIGLSYVLGKALFLSTGFDSVTLVLFYFLVSVVALIVMFVHFNKKFKENDNLQ